jgi:hypothetical protein
MQPISQHLACPRIVLASIGERSWSLSRNTLHEQRREICCTCSTKNCHEIPSRAFTATAELFPSSYSTGPAGHMTSFPKRNPTILSSLPLLHTCSVSPLISASSMSDQLSRDDQVERLCHPHSHKSTMPSTHVMVLIHHVPRIIILKQKLHQFSLTYVRPFPVSSS